MKDNWEKRIIQIRVEGDMDIPKRDMHTDHIKTITAMVGVMNH